MRNFRSRDLGYMGVAGQRLIVLPLNNIPNDDLEVYGDGAAVDGLNGGENGNNVFTISWATPYAARDRVLGLLAGDDMESYSDSAALGGLAGGTGFSAGYVSH